MVAVLQQGRLLVASIPSTANDVDLRDLVDNMSARITQAGANGVVIDVSALHILDSFATRMLQTVAEVARLRGARAAIVGIRPDVALSMVQLGLTLENIDTALDLEGAIRIMQDHKDSSGQPGH